MNKNYSNMRRINILILMMLCTFIAWGANTRTQSEIKQAAWQILHPRQNARGGESQIDNLTIATQLDAVTIVADGESGFAIISNDADCVPVVGYSHTKYDSSILPDGFKWWLDAINHSLLKSVAKTRSSVPSKYSPSVDPLLITRWGQGSPFNYKCPYKKNTVSGEMGQSVTGCVATAMAQILYYYRYPIQGVGSHTYEDGTFDYANTIFEWGNMLPEYYSGNYSYDQANAVATLMYACGVSVDMYYTPNESGASMNDVVSALKNYFSFDDTGELLWRSEYDGNWMNRIYSELHNGRPIIYRGTFVSTNDNFVGESHAFLLDGYDSEGFVHVNWGWAGQFDGYFDIDVLNPLNTDFGFNHNQGMIVNLRRNKAHSNLIDKSFTVSGKKIVKETLSLSLNVENTGANYSGNFYLFANKGGWKKTDPIQTKSISLNTAEEKNIEFSFCPKSSGSYYLWVTTDAKGKDIVGSITLNIGQNQGNIVFADPAVKRLCVEEWDTDGDGELSYAEAADVKDVRGTFFLSAQIGYQMDSFDEFRFFTGVKRISLTDFQWSSMKSITLPESIEVIEGEGFRESKIQSITIPKNVMNILGNPFPGCTELTEINVSPDNPIYISENGILYNKSKNILLAFPAGNAMTSFTIPHSVNEVVTEAFKGNQHLETVEITENITAIESGTFAGCVALKSIVIPDNVYSIDCNAFPGCKNLESVWIGKNVNWVQNNLFGGCVKLKKIDVDPDNNYFCSVDGVLMSKDKTVLYHYPPGRPGAVYRIPEGTTVFYDGFQGCKYLEEIILPESITDLGAIFKKTNIKRVTIPTWITEICEYAFSNCERLQEIKIPNHVKSIGQYAFTGCTSLSSVEIPNSITYLPEGIFSHCSSLKSITIPNSVTSIGKSAFENCSSLKSITLPNSVTSIADYAFWFCSDLASVTIPNSVTSIGDDAFADCYGLTSITFPSSVTSIGEGALWCCNNITDVYCLAKTVPTTTADDYFFSNFGNATLHVPSGSVDAYRAAAPWNRFKEIVGMKTPTISLNKTKTNLEKGKTLTLKATVSPSSFPCKDVTWKSSNTKVATVTSSGKVKAIKAGTATITCTSLVTSAKATCKVTVVNGTVTLDKSEAIIEKGKTLTLKATVTPTTLEDMSVTWKSSNTAVATVSSKGKITGVKAGTATITCTSAAAGTSATCDVTVGYVKLDQTEAVVEKTKTMTLKATVYPSKLEDKSVTWKSSNTAVATVSNKGKVTGVKAGKATITCTSNATGLSTTCKVTVGYVKLDQTEVSVKKGKTVTLTATVYPSTLTDKSVTWESSDKSIATVTSTGKVKGIKAGKATITCTSVATGLSTTCKVTVTGTSSSRSLDGDDDGDTTGIEDMETIDEAVNIEPFDVYDLRGQRVRHQVTSLDGLPDGIYIVNGKKMLKK